MGIRNKKRQVRRRLDSKTLDAQFIHEVRHGLNCSPFEAEVVLDVVKEIYFPFLDQQPIKAPPGKRSHWSLLTSMSRQVVDSELQLTKLCSNSLISQLFSYLGMPFLFMRMIVRKFLFFSQ